MATADDKVGIINISSTLAALLSMFERKAIFHHERMTEA